MATEKSPAEALARLSSTPLAMLPSFASALSRAIVDGTRAVFRDDSEGGAPGDPPGAGDSTVAVIPIRGMLSTHSGFWSYWFDLTTYDGIRGALNEAMADDSITAIVLDINSPGGLAAGNFDLADDIRRAGEKKVIYAHSGGLVCSAAYAIGSAAAHFFVSDSAAVGSVGVIITHVDWSAMDEKMGIKVTHIASGDRKADGSPDKPLSKESRASLQKEVDDTAEVFFERVAEWRGMTVEAVRGLEAGVFVGRAAVDKGLVDGIASLDQVIRAAMSGAGEGETMAEQKKGQSPVDLTASTEQATGGEIIDITAMISDDLKTIGATFPNSIEAAKALGREEGATAERERMSKIDSLTIPGRTELATKAKAEGWDIPRFLEAQTTVEQGARANHLTALQGAEDEEQADAAPVNADETQGNEDTPGELEPDATDETIARVWNANDAVRAEYSSLKAFTAGVRLEGYKPE